MHLALVKECLEKNPDATNYWSQAYVEECANRQKDILKMAMKTLKPGGQIIYSTCTFAPEEDEQIIEWLLDNYNLEVVPIKKIFRNGFRTSRMDF